MKYIFFVSLFYNCPCLVKGEASFSVFVKKKLLTLMLNWLSMNAIMKGLKSRRRNNQTWKFEEQV